MTPNTPTKSLVTRLAYWFDDSKQPIGSITISMTLIASIILTTLLILHNLFTGRPLLEIQSVVGLSCIVYLSLARWLLAIGKHSLARWLIVGLAALASISTLLVWGIHTAAAILMLSLSILLPGAFFGSRYMPHAILCTFSLLLAIQLLHSIGLVHPMASRLAEPSLLDTIYTYCLPLVGIFSVTWIFLRRSERAIKRARQAEKRLRTQKQRLRTQLQQESARLKSQQLKEVEQLYSFAMLGQDTAATLHELSNHLTVLGMDIDGLSDTSEHVDAINSVKESLGQINRMVRTVRGQMNPYTETSLFTPYATIRQVLTDLHGISSTTPAIKLRLLPVSREDKKLSTYGNPSALAHILTILIKNSLEACSNLHGTTVHVLLERTPANVRILVTDDGPGISTGVIKALFRPLESSKMTGLGIGLYIARNLAKTQFKGSLRLMSNGIKNTDKGYLAGATFALEIPRPTAADGVPK